MGKIAFIDEYGDKSIEHGKQGVSKFFIVTAIIVDSSLLENIKTSVESIRKKFTQAPELKSSAKVFQDINKRIQLLQELTKLDIHIYSIVVDKRNIFEDSGLQFRESFFKYVNRLLDTELFRYYPKIEIIADEHGTDKFMNGFIEYLKKHHYQPDLFTEFTFNFGKSKDENLIQVADIISGSLARHYDPDKTITSSDQIIEILKPKILHIREWPHIPANYLRHINSEELRYNSEIAEYSVYLAEKFITENDRKIDETSIQKLITLTFLLYRFKHNPFDYVNTDEIIKRIEQRGTQVKSKQVFRGEVIANLRDQGVLITSGQNGYKIPCSKSDFIEFFNRYTHVISPMLLRLDNSNKLIKIATDGKFNLFDIPEFKALEQMIAILKQ